MRVYRLFLFRIASSLFRDVPALAPALQIQPVMVGPEQEQEVAGLPSKYRWIAIEGEPQRDFETVPERMKWIATSFGFAVCVAYFLSPLGGRPVQRAGHCYSE